MRGRASFRARRCHGRDTCAKGGVNSCKALCIYRGGGQADRTLRGGGKLRRGTKGGCMPRPVGAEQTQHTHPSVAAPSIAPSSPVGVKPAHSHNRMYAPTHDLLEGD